jgi:hypothetical protein
LIRLGTPPLTAAKAALQVSSTSIVGGFADGVLGVTKDGGKITDLSTSEFAAGLDFIVKP